MIPSGHRSKILCAASAVLMLACADRPTEANSPASTGNGGPTDPSFTNASGFVTTSVNRGNLGAFHIQSKAGDYDAELKSHDNTDIVVANIAVAPLGHSGWHYHPGPVLVVVKTGTITFYMGNDPTCTAQVHHAGTAFIEDGGMVGIARNESTSDEATVVATFLVPQGGATRFDVAPAPGNCAF